MSVSFPNTDIMIKTC